MENCIIISFILDVITLYYFILLLFIIILCILDIITLYYFILLLFIIILYYLFYYYLLSLYYLFYFKSSRSSNLRSLVKGRCFDLMFFLFLLERHIEA